MRLFFTAGTQFPFARMDEVVQRVAQAQPDWPLIYQAGPNARLEPLRRLSNLDVCQMLPAERFAEALERADLVITHAGMGNVMTCLEQGKPFLMMPRLARHGEHRNDHQVDSAESVQRLYGIPVFHEVDALVEVLCEQRVDLAAQDVSEHLTRQRAAFAQELQALIDS